MKLTKVLAISSLPLFLVACGGQPISQQELQFLQSQAEQQTLKIDCPAGCSVSYKDPRDKVVIPQRTNGWDAAIAATGSLERIASGAVPIIGMGYLGKEAIRSLKGSGEKHTTITNTSIGDYSGDNSGRIGDYSGSQSGNSGILGDYAGQQSGNAGSLYSDIPGRVNSPNEGRFSSPDDYSNNSRITTGGGL